VHQMMSQKISASSQDASPYKPPLLALEFAHGEEEPNQLPSFQLMMPPTLTSI